MQIPKEHHHLYDLKKPRYAYSEPIRYPFKISYYKKKKKWPLLMSLTAYEKLKSTLDHERTSESYKKPILPA